MVAADCMGKYILQHLEEALENHWVQVYYQPVIRTLTGDLCGLEALARWVDPQGGYPFPGHLHPGAGRGPADPPAGCLCAGRSVPHHPPAAGCQPSHHPGFLQPVPV